MRKHRIAAILIALALLIPTTLGIRSFVGAQQEKSHMSSYLQNKYGKEFVVTKYHISGGDVFEQGAPTAQARPSDNKDITFRVQKQFKVQKQSPSPDKYLDTYLEELWSHQARAAASNYLHNNLSEIDSFSFRVGPSDRLDESIKGTTPNLWDISSSDIGCTLTIHSSVKTTPNEPSSANLEAAFKAVQYAKSLHMVNSEFYYIYRDQTSTSDSPYPYAIHVNGNKAVNDIQTASDLGKYFTKQ